MHICHHQCPQFTSCHPPSLPLPLLFSLSPLIFSLSLCLRDFCVSIFVLRNLHTLSWRCHPQSGSLHSAHPAHPAQSGLFAGPWVPLVLLLNTPVMPIIPVPQELVSSWFQERQTQGESSVWPGSVGWNLHFDQMRTRCSPGRFCSWVLEEKSAGLKDLIS